MTLRFISHPPNFNCPRRLRDWQCHHVPKAAPPEQLVQTENRHTSSRNWSRRRFATSVLRRLRRRFENVVRYNVTACDVDRAGVRFKGRHTEEGRSEGTSTHHRSACQTAITNRPLPPRRTCFGKSGTPSKSFHEARFDQINREIVASSQQQRPCPCNGRRSEGKCSQVWRFYMMGRGHERRRSCRENDVGDAGSALWPRPSSRTCRCVGSTT